MLIVLKGQGAGRLGVLCGLLMDTSVLDPPGLLYKSNSIILGSFPSWWTIPQRSCLIWKPRVQHRIQGGHHSDHSRSKSQNQICSLKIHAFLHSLVHFYPFLLWKKKGSKISCCSCLMAKKPTCLPHLSHFVRSGTRTQFYGVGHWVHSRSLCLPKLALWGTRGKNEAK